MNVRIEDLPARMTRLTSNPTTEASRSVLRNGGGIKLTRHAIEALRAHRAAQNAAAMEAALS
jgi:hypothetical protein